MPRIPESGLSRRDDAVPAFRRVLLTDQGRKYIEETFLRSGKSVHGLWHDYYDTATFVLARRDARLRESAGEWELQIRGSVPLSGTHGASLLQAEGAPDVLESSKHVAGYRAFPGTKDILDYLGVCHTAEVPDVARALAQKGVKPIARWRTDLHKFSFDLKPGMGRVNSHGGRIFIDMEDVYFDTAYADPSAVSALIQIFGTAEGVRQNLRATFAEFRIHTFAEDTAGNSEVTAFMQCHGLDRNGGGCSPGHSVLAAYLRLCRPYRLRDLRKIGVSLSHDESEEMNSHLSLKRLHMNPLDM